MITVILHITMWYSVRLGALPDIECVFLRDIERVSLRGVRMRRSPPMSWCVARRLDGVCMWRSTWGHA